MYRKYFKHEQDALAFLCGDFHVLYRMDLFFHEAMEHACQLIVLLVERCENICLITIFPLGDLVL